MQGVKQCKESTGRMRNHRYSTEFKVTAVKMIALSQVSQAWTESPGPMDSLGDHLPQTRNKSVLDSLYAFLISAINCTGCEGREKAVHRISTMLLIAEGP